MTQVRGVIFDIDGTLVDSNDAHAHAWVEAMAEQGYQVPFEKVRPLIGMGGDKVLPETLGIAKDSEVGKRISQRRKELFKQRYLPHLKAFPGAMELLERMHEQGLKLIIATSADPDEIAAAVQRSGCSPQELVMIGDTAYDIEAAAKVNIKTIAFRCGGWSDKDLAGAIMIYDGPADLLAHYDTTVLVKRL